MRNLYERVEALSVGTIFQVGKGNEVGAPWMRGMTNALGVPYIWDLMVPLVVPSEKPIPEGWYYYPYDVVIIYTPEEDKE